MCLQMVCSRWFIFNHHTFGGHCHPCCRDVDQSGDRSVSANEVVYTQKAYASAVVCPPPLARANVLS